jgi:hypothetical protein
MSGMLMDERFVAVFPSLVRRLGSLESAVILQHMWWLGDENGFIKVTQQQISDETGIGLRTVERRVRWLREQGYVVARRTSAYDATLTYEIDTDRLAESSSPSRQSGGL